jgi:hypothetical protein
MIDKQRKLDTRRKIQIGGLAIKANIDYLFDMDTKRMLGAFIYLNKLINDDMSSPLLKQFDQIGQNEFDD